jgi:hypothetical protein
MLGNIISMAEFIFILAYIGVIHDGIIASDGKGSGAP